MPIVNAKTGRKLLHATRLPRFLRELHLGALRAEGCVRARVRGTDSSEPDPNALKVLAISPTYPPDHLGGAVVTLHCVLLGLRRLGHSTRVLVTDSDHSRVVDGIEVVTPTDRTIVTGLVQWSDVVIAQLKSRGPALRLAARHRRPLVYYFHLGNTPRGATFGKPSLTLFSTHVMRNQYPEIDPALILHPPIAEAEYLTKPGDAITLINMSELKGGNLFFELADRMPGRSFIGVEGWGTQVVPGRIRANVTVLPKQHDMREVYGKTRILLMPSAHESYGRVALEAAASGIPTIACPSDGVREAIGDACLSADRGDIEAWTAQIEALDDPVTYARYSAAARRRFEELDARSEILALEGALRELACGTPA